MSSYEFTGKSVKDAIAKACEELNLAEDNLEVEVMEESARGFLGIVGQRDARIRVKIINVAKDESDFFVPEAPMDLDTQTLVQPGIESQRPCSSLEEKPNTEMSSPEGAHEESRIEQEALTILEGILHRIPVDAQVVASTSGNAITLDIKGDGSGLLIGKKGQTLDALQFLLNKIINKNCSSDNKIELIVDTENYQQRKSENLRETALRMSLKAKKTLRPVSFNPMSPSERRIIHLILAEDSEVYTKSYGEGLLRRIIVYPKRGSANKRRRR